MQNKRAEITIGAFLYSIENMGGPSLFKSPIDEKASEVDFLSLMFDSYYDIHGPALALCYGSYHGLALPTPAGQEVISGAFQTFCKGFHLDEDEIRTFSDEQILMLLNDLFSFTGEKAEYDRPGIDPKILKLMEIFPMMRLGLEYRKYFLKS